MSKVKTVTRKVSPMGSTTTSSKKAKPASRVADPRAAKGPAKSRTKPTGVTPKKPVPAKKAASSKKPVPAKKAAPPKKPVPAKKSASSKKPVPAKAPAKPKSAVPGPKKPVPAKAPAKPKSAVPAPQKPAPAKAAAKPQAAAPAPKKTAPAKPKSAVPTPKKPAPAKAPAKPQAAAPAPKKTAPAKAQSHPPRKPTAAEEAPTKTGSKLAAGRGEAKTAGKSTKEKGKGRAIDEAPSSEREFDDDVEDDDEDAEGDLDEDDLDEERSHGEDEEDDDEAPDSDRPVRRGVREAPESRGPASAMPVIPLPVKELPKLPSLEERAARIEQRLAKQGDEFRAAYDGSFDMSWVFHDTGLEGVIYTFEELQSAFRSHDVGHLDSSIVPIFHAIKRNQAAIALIREMVSDRQAPITVDLVRKIYVTLHPDEGDVKTVKYRRDIPQHRLYFHEYAAPDKIAPKLRTLTDWINAPESLKTAGALKLAAKAHYDLARIYPFPKDSGKVARLLMNLLLMRAGFPPAIMHHSERQRYYDALKAASATPLVQMVRDAVENSIGSIEKLLDDHDQKARGFAL